jgi:hypothetical protein
MINAPINSPKLQLSMNTVQLWTYGLTSMIDSKIGTDASNGTSATMNKLLDLIARNRDESL